MANIGLLGLDVCVFVLNICHACKYMVFYDQHVERRLGVHTHTHTATHTHTHTNTQTLSLAHTHTFTRKHSHTHATSFCDSTDVFLHIFGLKLKKTQLSRFRT